MKEDDLELRKRLSRLLWTKSNPWQPISLHMICTGAVAQTLLTKGCFFPLLKELGQDLGLTAGKAAALSGYLTSGHDVGKVHPAFVGSGAVSEAAAFLREYGHAVQGQMEEFRHERYGALCAYRIWIARKQFSKPAARSFRSVILLHHQGYRSMDNGELDDGKKQICAVLLSATLLSEKKGEFMGAYKAETSHAEKNP